jgi:hypothetical protein
MASARWRRTGFERARGRRGDQAPRPKDRRCRLEHRLEELESRLVLSPGVSLSIADPVPIMEGNSGTTNLMFVVTRSGDTGPALTVDFQTQDGTAQAGFDYQPTSGRCRSPPGRRRRRSPCRSSATS